VRGSHVICNKQFNFFVKKGVGKVSNYSIFWGEEVREVAKKDALFTYKDVLLCTYTEIPKLHDNQLIGGGGGGRYMFLSGYFEGI
jgi:hypothetical protein